MDLESKMLAQDKHFVFRSALCLYLFFYQLGLGLNCSQRSEYKCIHWTKDSVHLWGLSLGIRYLHPQLLLWSAVLWPMHAAWDRYSSCISHSSAWTQFNGEFFELIRFISPSKWFSGTFSSSFSLSRLKRKVCIFFRCSLFVIAFICLR